MPREQTIQPLNKSFEEVVKAVATHNTNAVAAEPYSPHKIRELSVPKTSGDVQKEEIGEAVIYLADCKDAFQKIANNSVDFIATDPPYFLDGMGDEWSDSDLKKKQARAGAVGGLPVGMKFDPSQGK